MDAEMINQIYQYEEWFTNHQVSEKILYLIGFFIVAALLIVIFAKR